MDWRAITRVLFPRRTIESDVDDELQFHIDGRIRDLVESGWDEAEARAEVLARFGDVDRLAEECRSYDTQRVNGESWRMTMEGWMRDVRLALGSMHGNAGFTAIVVLTLALGIGATTSVFSVVEGILLRPMPFAHPDALAIVWQNDRATGTVREDASTADYYDYVERSRTFEDLAMSGSGTAVMLRPDADPIQLDLAVVSHNLAEVLGITLQAGRNFTPAEDTPDGPSVVILTDRMWRDALGADPAVVGRVLDVDGRSVEVVGILPPGIDYPTGSTDLWAPIQQDRLSASRVSHWVQVIGRLDPSASVEAANAEMVSIMADLEREYPSANTNRGALVERLSDVGRGDLRLTLWVLFAAVMAVLAIACVNVANLLLARGATRTRELAVLSAIGAGAGHITRKFFVEGAIMTLLAVVGGVLLAGGGVRLLTALAPDTLLLLGEPEVNAKVLGFALGVSVLICLGFGLLPTLQARGLDLQSQLRDGRTSEGSSAGLSLRRLLVAGQLSLAVVLLMGATLLIGTVRNLQAIDPGFRAENTVRVDFAIPTSYVGSMADYPDWPSMHQFLDDLEAGTEAMPGVSSAAVVYSHPLDPGFTNSFVIEGQAYDPTAGEMTTRLVSPSYFETVGLGLVAGRLLDAGDRVGAPHAILLNEEAASRYFPAGDALGHRIAFWGPTYREVVGIVKNERIHGLAADVPPAMYVSLRQAPPRGGKVTMMARTEVPPLSVVDGIRSVIRTVDAGVPVFNVSTMEETVSDAMARERFASTVLTIFAGIALFLALLGVHGVLAYLVAQRAHELGVRMALGASRRDVVNMVVRQGATMTVVGIVVGLGAALGLAGLIRGMLYGVSATSPVIYAGVALVMGLVAISATALPARRAAAVDPVASLRRD